jgi:hypothetical protein
MGRDRITSRWLDPRTAYLAPVFRVRVCGVHRSWFEVAVRRRDVEGYSGVAFRMPASHFRIYRGFFDAVLHVDQ